MRSVFFTTAWALLALGCAGDPQESAAPEAASVPSSESLTLEAIAAHLDTLQQRVDSLDAILYPVALLNGRETRALTRYPNREQLAKARALGVADADSEQARAALLSAGRLVRLPDSTRYWIVRELDHSLPLVTPDAEVLLTRLGERFHEALADKKLPPYRLEISSALRTSDTQADLRRTNPNATRGTSTHEYGTTVDVAYSAFSYPAGRIVPASSPLPPAIAARLEALYLERLAGQRSRELQAILGRVLIGMQNDGLVMVTLEERQPVFHMTVARRLSAR